MKKVGFMMWMCFVFIGLMAQQKTVEMADLKVEPPKFDKNGLVEVSVESQKSSINRFIEQELEVAEQLSLYRDEGIVAVQFTIAADGTVSNFEVKNHVSALTDNAVIECLRKTDGMWIPGKVAGEYTPMEKLVFVKFDVIGNPSHIEMAQSYFSQGVRHFNTAMVLDENVFLTEKRKIRKTERQLSKAYTNLDLALKYAPDDISVLFWQAKIYEQQGEIEQMNDKLDKYLELVQVNHSVDELATGNELAVIVRQN